MNLLLINQPLGNRGDESAHKALVRTLLAKDANIKICVLFIGSTELWSLNQFKVLDDRVQYLNLHPFFKYSKIGDVALQERWRRIFWEIHPFTRRLISYYKWANVVVCAPGGICMGGFQNWHHLYLLNLAKYCKRNLAYYGRSFGPFPTDTSSQRLFKKISYEMLHYFSFLSIRDKVSESIADEIGVSYVSTVDTAFLETPDVDIPYEVKSLLRGVDYIVFVPNSLLWHYAYEGKCTEEELIDFYCELIKIVWEYKPELKIVMLPQVYGKGGQMDDLPFFRMIGEELNDERVIVLPDCYNSDIQQTIIKDSQLVIGARYHSIVFAINQNIPFVALCYEHKMTGLLNTLGKEDCVVNICDMIISKQGRNLLLKDIRRLLPMVKADKETRQKAKDIAQNCINQFLVKFEGEINK